MARTLLSRAQASAVPALKLKNGFVLSRKGGTGPGILVIKNGNNREGVVKLVSKDKRMSIYVARKGSAQVYADPGRQLRRLLRQRRVVGRQAQHVHAATAASRSSRTR